MEICRDYVRTVNANITHFLSGRSNWMAFRLEAAASHFPDFWARIGAEGAYEAALAEWEVRHNAS